MLTFLVLSLALLPLSQAGDMIDVGPEVPSLVVKGQITQNGEPVPALVSLEVLYKLNGNLVPLSLVQTNSLSNYRLYLSGLVFQNKDITYTGILRVQSLSINGGSRAVKLHLKDGKVLYQQDIELNAQDYPEDDENEDYPNKDYPLEDLHRHRTHRPLVHRPLLQHQDVRGDFVKEIEDLVGHPHPHRPLVQRPHTHRPLVDLHEIEDLREGGEEDLHRHRTRRPLVNLHRRPHLLRGVRKDLPNQDLLLLRQTTRHPPKQTRRPNVRPLLGLQRIEDLRVGGEKDLLIQRPHTRSPNRLPLFGLHKIEDLRVGGERSLNRIEDLRQQREAVTAHPIGDEEVESVLNPDTCCG